MISIPGINKDGRPNEHFESFWLFSLLPSPFVQVGLTFPWAVKCCDHVCKQPNEKLLSEADGLAAAFGIRLK